MPTPESTGKRWQNTKFSPSQSELTAYDIFDYAFVLLTAIIGLIKVLTPRFKKSASRARFFKKVDSLCTRNQKISSVTSELMYQYANGC